MKIKSSKPENLNGKGLKIAIILSRFNDSIGDRLFENTIKTLKECSVDKVEVVRVPGALEIPLAAQEVAGKNHYDAIIALGVVIKGETYHFELVCENSHAGILDTSLKTRTPIIFGVITAFTPDQALQRCDRGTDYAHSAIEMALLMKELRQNKKDVE
ncbi:6,7-dimethyl-8-ribityllumazine synthase [Patescibacteria group bacterium]|nr:6,7-dimethyl-8-ribityllumazine synthase [Patescibacteria group bacterium]MBU1702799.1 6,7-dimethyl-8-ribityllumazine synthase [Patescibacteria group bacterium]MBU1953808.1 6,7-dimethyl-8-ribityllumazine synthase [Patescibacteria group bacterium]